MFEKVTKKRAASVFALLSTLAVLVGLVQPTASSADSPFTVTIGDAQTVATNSTAQFPVTITCRQAGGCAGATINFSRPVMTNNGTTYQLQGPMVIGLASGSNPAITYNTSGLAGDTPSMTFTRLDQNQSQVFNVSWQTTENRIIPGKYTMDWSGVWAAQNYNTSGRSSVAVTGTPKINLAKTDVTNNGPVFDGSFRQFELSWFREKNGTGITGVTTELVDQLPPEYIFKGFTETGIGGDMLFRNLQGQGEGIVYFYDAATHTVRVRITESVDRYIAQKNTVYSKIRYNVQVDPAKTANLADGAKITNTVSATNPTSLDGKPVSVNPASVFLTYKKARQGIFSKARVGGEYSTTTTDTGLTDTSGQTDPGSTLGWTLSATNPGTDPRTLTISDTTSWGATVPVGKNGTPSNYHYLTSISLNPVQYNDGLVNYPARVIGYSADGTQKTYTVTAGSPLSIPESDKIIRFDVIVDNLRPVDALPNTSNNGVLTVNVKTKYRIETNQIVAANNGASGSIRLNNTATFTIDGSAPVKTSSFFTIFGRLPAPQARIQALNATNLQRGETFLANTSVFAASEGGPSRPEAFLSLPPGFELAQPNFLAGRDPAQCGSAPSDWAFEKVTDKYGGQVWRIYLKDPNRILQPGNGTPTDCFQLSIKAANTRAGTYDKGPMTDPKHTIQLWVHEQPDPGQTNKLSHTNLNIPDVYDVNSDGNTAGQWRNAGTPVAVASTTSLGVSKRALGDLDKGKPTTFVPGGNEQTSLAQKSVNFTVTASTTGSTPVNGMVLYDLLPSGKNSGTSHVNLVNGLTNADNTQVTFEPKLSGPVTASGHNENVTVFYSTVANPCRPELSSGTGTSTNNFPNCQTFNERNEWSTTLPADPSTVTAIRIQFNTTVFGDFDFDIPMSMPKNNVDGQPVSTNDVATNRAAVAGKTETGAAIPFVGPAYARVSPWGEMRVDKSSIIKEQSYDETTKAPDVRRGDEFLWVIEASANKDGATIPDPTVIDYLPPGVEVLGVSKDAPYATNGDAQVNGQTVTWKPGDITSGSKAYLYLRVKATGSGDQRNYTYYQDPTNPTKYVDACTAGSETPNPGCDVNTVHIDAGNAQISGNYFTDVDQSNTQTTGDTPRVGESVFLYEVQPDGSLRLVSRKVTDANGNYTFRDLPAGQYVVGFEKSASADFATPNVGTNEAADSDVTGTREEPGFGTVGLVDKFTLAENQNKTNVDAGVQGKASISGIVFMDTNGDGQRTGQNSDLVNEVVVTLLNADGSPAVDAAGQRVASITTGADGAYKFTNLRPGDYKVKATLPDGATYTYSKKVATADQVFEPNYNDGAGPFSDTPGVTDTFTTKEGENPNVDFGVQPFASIGGVVFTDANGDGQSTNDKPAPNVTVDAYVFADGAYKKVATTTTDADGKYSFNNLVPGSYATRVVKPDGFVGFSPQTPNSSTIIDDGSDASNNGGIDFGVIGPGSTDHQRGDAGLLQPSSLSGEIFYDDNNNGLRDANEALKTLPLTINVFRAGTTDLVATTKTSNGAWKIDNIAPGDYYIQVINPGKARFGSLATTYPTAGTTIEKLVQENFNDVVEAPGEGGITSTFSVAGGQNYPHIDTGVVRLQAVDGHVWEDTNANGDWNDGEEPLSGITVELTMVNGQKLTTVTDVNGYYRFDGVSLGQATITIIKPDGTKFTRQANTDSGFDAITKPKLSDVSADTGAVTFEVNGYTDPKNPTGTDVVNVDAGLVPLSSVSGEVFNDLNRDGLRTLDESQRADVEVTLYRAGTNEEEVVGKTTTGADGTYTFDGVAPGDYYVVFTAPDGTKFTTIPADKGTDGMLGRDGNDADDNGQTATFKVGAGAPATNIDAGLIIGANISGLAWKDLNDNGIRDADEMSADSLYANAPITLYNGAGEKVSTVMTAADGTYKFVNVPAGDGYHLKVELNDSAVSFSVSNDLTDKDHNNFDGKGVRSGTVGQTAKFTVVAGEDHTDIDLGTVPKAGAAGTVFEDQNRNGKLDSGEPGIADVPVQIFVTGTNELVTTVKTDAYGNWYTDTTLANTDYYVVFQTLDGKKITQKLAAADGNLATAGLNDANPTDGKTETFQVKPNEQLNNIDAGYIINGGIRGIVFNDANNDGKQGTNEAPYADFTVILLDANGNEVARTVTDEQGAYSFPQVAPGDYTVRFEPPADLKGQFTSGTSTNIQDPNVSDVNTQGITQKITVGLGDSVTNVDAGFVQYASISGIAFVDTDGDNKSTGASDTLLAGVKVVLYRVDENGDPIRVVGREVTTAPDGTYQFDGLVPGNYSVRFVNDVLTNEAIVSKDATAAGGSDINPDGFTDPIKAEAATAYNNVDAGYVTSGYISGQVWNDTNGDGFRQDSETVREGVTVTLLSSTGEVIAQTTTDDNGAYSFNGQPAGDYIIKVEPIEGYAYSPKKGDGAITAGRVSDIDQTSGKTQVFRVDAGKSVINVDGGVVPTSSISGRAFNDQNADGAAAGDTPREGTTVILLDETGKKVAETTTDASGNYMFSNIPVGKYTVEFQATNGEKFSPKGVDSLVDNGGRISVTLTEGNPVTAIDAGYVTTAKISGLAFIDATYDGKYGTSVNPKIIPADGTTVELLDEQGNPLPQRQIVTVGADGRYTFFAAPGTYRVQFRDPSGQPITKMVGDPNNIQAPGMNDADPATGRTAPFTVAAGEEVDNVDGGIRSTTSISGHAFTDVNGDKLDGNEPPRSGVTVELRDAAGNVVQTTTTDETGNYHFDDLLPGEYTVHFPSLDGKLFSGGDSKVDKNGDVAVKITPEMSRSGQGVTGIDAGYKADTGTIQGTVFWDDARDGKYDEGDPLYTDAKVTVIGDGGTSYDGTVADGKFNFPDLPVGKYTVTVEANGASIVRVVEVTANDVVTVDVPLERDPTPTDTTSPTETTTPTGSTEPTTPTDTTAPTESTEPTATTEPGSPTEPTTPTQEPRFDISGQLWHDDDRNAAIDSGENGLDGVTVELRDANGTVVATTKTDASGKYEFNGVPAGDYQVVVPRTVDNMNIVNSKLDGDLNGDSWIVKVSSTGGAITDVNFGFDNPDTTPTDPTEPTSPTDPTDPTDPTGPTVTTDPTTTDPTTPTEPSQPSGPTTPTTPKPEPKFDITGRLWHDDDRNAVVDGSEKGLEGVTVELRDSNGKVVATTTTDADGKFVFKDVPAGEYEVVVPRTAQNLDIVNSSLPGRLDGDSWVVKVVSSGDGAVTGVDFGFDAKDPAPTDPTKPTDTTEPTTPTVPSDSTKPSEPTEPTKPTEATTPTVPSDSTKPSEPDKPGEPTKASEPAKPGTPGGSTDTTKPDKPGKPGGPVDTTPGGSSTPAQPGGSTGGTDGGSTGGPAQSSNGGAEGDHQGEAQQDQSLPQRIIGGLANTGVNIIGVLVAALAALTLGIYFIGIRRKKQKD